MARENVDFVVYDIYIDKFVAGHNVVVENIGDVITVFTHNINH